MLNALLTATTTRTFIEMASIHIIISANYVMCEVFTTIGPGWVSQPCHIVTPPSYSLKHY